MFKLLLFLVLIFNYECNTLRRFPRYVGLGYDIVTGNPKTNQVDRGFKSNVVVMTYNDGEETENGDFLIPDKMKAIKRNSCSFMASTKQFTGTRSYQESLRNLVEVSTDVNGWLISSSFSASTEFRSMTNSTISRQSIVFDSEASCEVYSVFMQRFDLPPLSGNFINAIMKAAENPKNNDTWKQFIDEFGTHYVLRANFGGRMNLQSRVQRQSVQELTAMDINVGFAAGLRYKLLSGNIDIEVESNREVLNEFERRVEETRRIYIGGRPPESNDSNEWSVQVSERPMPTSYTLVSLSTLITNRHFPNFSSEKIQELQDAFNRSLGFYCANLICQPGIDLPVPPNLTAHVQNTTLFFDHIRGNRTNFADDRPSKPLMRVYKVFIYLQESSGIREIRGMQFMLSDSFNKEFTPFRGFKANILEEWNVPDGQHITQIEVHWGGAWLSGLRFMTNRGARSTLFGRASINTGMVNLNGDNLVGIYGYVSFFEQFRSIGFVTTSVF